MAVENEVSWWGVHVVMPIALLIGGGWVGSLSSRLRKLEEVNSNQDTGLAVHGSKFQDLVARLDRIEGLVMKIALNRHIDG